MFDEYIYIIKVFDIDDTYEYQHRNLRNALEQYKDEFEKGNRVGIYRSKDGILERYHDRTNTWG